MTCKLSHRVVYWDMLRGAAVLAMLADHALAVLGSVSVTSGPRLLLHLFEPVFATLFGLFSARAHGFVRRFGRLFLAACLANLVFFPVAGKFEILGTFFVVMPWAGCYPRAVLVCGLATVASGLDSTGAVFDYPVGLVATQVALGALARSRSRWVWLCVALLPIGAFLELPWSFIACVTPVAILLIVNPWRFPSLL